MGVGIVTHHLTVLALPCKFYILHAPKRVIARETKSFMGGKSGHSRTEIRRGAGQRVTPVRRKARDANSDAQPEREECLSEANAMATWR